MAEKAKCERCLTNIGNFGTQDYCVKCSENLCNKCMVETGCRGSDGLSFDIPKEQHKAWSESEDLEFADVDKEDRYDIDNMCLPCGNPMQFCTC